MHSLTNVKIRGFILYHINCSIYQVQPDLQSCVIQCIWASFRFKAGTLFRMLYFSWMAVTHFISFIIISYVLVENITALHCMTPLKVQ